MPQLETTRSKEEDGELIRRETRGGKEDDRTLNADGAKKDEEG